MKSKAIGIALLAILVLLAVSGLLKRHSEKPAAQKVAEPHGEPDPPQTDNQPVNVSTPLSQYQREQMEAMAKSKGVALNMLTQEAFLQMSQMEHEMNASVNRPVSFYGKVVDENERPVKNATVQFGCVVFPGSQIVTNVVSDAEGTFSLGSLSGAILTVQVNKQGYEEAPGSNRNSFTYYSPLPNGGLNSDPRNPIIFRIRKRTE